jgi:hypothetical protein
MKTVNISLARRISELDGELSDLVHCLSVKLENETKNSGGSDVDTLSLNKHDIELIIAEGKSDYFDVEFVSAIDDTKASLSELFSAFYFRAMTYSSIPALALDAEITDRTCRIIIDTGRRNLAFSSQSST